MRRVIFLPGASGDPEFWRPVAERLPADWEKVRLGWPGLGDQPHDPAVRSIDDLVGLAEAKLSPASDLVAQSLGGVVAIQVAARHPDKVRRLVLVVTSGGLGISLNEAEDWRQEYRQAYPNAAAWIAQPLPDHSPTIAGIACPTLLIWGDADPISPVAIGDRLARLLPNAKLTVIAGGTHSLAVDHAEEVARSIAEHLR